MHLILLCWNAVIEYDVGHHLGFKTEIAVLIPGKPVLKLWIKHHGNRLKCNTKMLVQWKGVLIFVVVFGSNTIEISSDLKYNTKYLNQKL